MRNRFGGNKEMWYFIIGAILILSIIFTIITQSSQDTLDVYTESNRVEQQESTDEEEEVEIETFIYTDSDNNLSIEFPEGWEQVTMDGYETFIHSASASSVQIVVEEYAPSINNTSEETISTQVVEDGYTFITFESTSASSYELLYQDLKNSTYDYIEDTYWDREKIITLKCVFNDSYYEQIIPYYEKILNSFVWDAQDPIPDGYYLYYSEGVQCEFGVPSAWTLGESEGSVYASDQTSGAYMSVTAQQYTGSLDDVTATDVTSLISSGYSTFILKSFETSTTEALAVFTHVEDNVQYLNYTYLFADGQYLIMMSFDYEDGTIDDSIPGTCAGLYRSFVSGSGEDAGVGDDAAESDSAEEDESETESNASDEESSESSTSNVIE